MNNLFEETKFLMKKYNIKANKKLGQNFLIDEKVIEDIVAGADIQKDDLVIEIGPGLGSMTKVLLDQAKKVICIELDDKMVEILKDRFLVYDNIKIIKEDVLKIDLNKLIEEEQVEGKVKIVANLPYYITTPIIMKLLEEELDIESITVMIQKEVADRLIEIPGNKNTGAITYTVYYFCESRKIREVENTSFLPMPEVRSEVINLQLRKNKVVQPKEPKDMFKIIKVAFQQRRKTLLNALCNGGIFKDKNQGIQILQKIGLNENVRAENLTIQDFYNLNEQIYN